MRLLGPRPTAANQAIPRGYMDASTFVTPPVAASWVQSPGYLGLTNTQLNVSGRVTFHPFWLSAGTYTRMAVSVQTATAGSTSMTMLTGLYPDDGSFSLPDTSQLLMRSSGSYTLTTTGVKTQTAQSSVTLTTGMYWAAVSHVFTGTQSTILQMFCVVNSMWSIPALADSNALSRIRGYVLTGQSTLPTTATARTSFNQTSSNDLVAVALGTS